MRLIVNAPSGHHEVTEIGLGGSYFDPSRILWREDTDGLLPPRPAGFILSEIWKTDPLNPSICWRSKTAAEMDSEKTEQAVNLADYKLVDLAKAQIDWNTITDLKTKFPTFAEYKQAIIDRYKALLP